VRAVSDPIHAVVELDAAPYGPLAFGLPRAVVEARSLGEVRAALRAVDEATRAGRWAVGYLASEAAPAFDPALTVREPGPGPLLWFGLHDAPLGPPPPGPVDARLVGLEPELDAAAHAASVERLREAIGAGAAYQVNLTLRLHGRLEGEPLALYRRLRAAQGGGQTVYLRAGDLAVVSASPELFLLRQGARLLARPMKGTARRGRWAGEDEAAARALAGSSKERAENVMIADLLRNDLGRIAETGSVRATALFEPERYRTVWQLTSTVEATIAPGVGLEAIFAATFPCGSVTGAPKASAMRLVAAEERSPRGVYCGAAGLVAPGGDCAFNVAIRTAEVSLSTGATRYGAGGGVTFASSAAAEWDELLAKVAVLELDPSRPTLLETMRLEGGRVALLDLHLARLAGSARYHASPLDLAAVRAMVGRERGDGRLRLLLPPDGRPRLERGPLPAPPPGPVRVAISPSASSSRDPARFHKTTDRAFYEARRSARPDCFDVILSNEAGLPVESTIANLVVELDGAAFTPPLEAGLLPGVQRAALLAQGAVRERTLTVADLRRAGRIWLVNALRGRVEARLVD
jgi:para-aminobenzoate synthetase/4-amino-4-deoxychorismate lyase